MTSLNPFEETEDTNPIPPHNIELIPVMSMNPVTGRSYAPEHTHNNSAYIEPEWDQRADRLDPTHIYPALPIPAPTPRGTFGPSAPPMPPPTAAHKSTRSCERGGYHSLPRTHASTKSHPETKLGIVTRPKSEENLFGIIASSACSHSSNGESYKVRYKRKVEQAKNELNSYFNDLQKKLNEHHENLLEELDRKYRANSAVIEEKEQEIEQLKKTESTLPQNKGDSFGKLKDVLSEQKRSLEAEINPLTEIKLSYKPELLGDVINKLVSILPGPDSTSPVVTRHRRKSETRSEEKQTIVLDSQVPYSDTRLGPITHNIGMGALVDQVQDPAGIVVDKHQNNAIYVADKEKHRVQVYDRSGNFLKSITKGEKMRYPHSLAVSNDSLFVLCAGRPEDKQYVLKFDKMTGVLERGLILNDIRHIPICVFQENVYMPTYISMVEVFSVKLKSCKKIDINLEKKNSMSIFSSGPEIRDICVNGRGIYLLVLNSENGIQVFNFDGNLINTLAPLGLGCLVDARYFTVDNRGTVLVTEGREGRVKMFKPGDKNIQAVGQAKMGGEMEKLTAPRGIDVDSHGKVVLCCAQKEWLLKEC